MLAQQFVVFVLYILHMKKTTPELIYARIREARQYAGYSQKDFGPLLGVTPAAVSAWEQANPELRRYPNHFALIKISELTGAPVKWLITGLGALGEGDDGLIHVPLISTHLALAEGIEAPPTYEMLGFKSSWLKTKLQNIDHAFLMKCPSDFSNKIVRPGDLLLIDTEGLPEMSNPDDSIYATKEGAKLSLVSYGFVEDKLANGESSFAPEFVGSQNRYINMPQIMGRAVWRAGDI